MRFDVRSTGADDRTVAPLAAAIARETPDVIVAVGEKETRAALAAAPKTPVVFIQIPDPVAIGLVTSVARPGGHVTGVADLRTELVPKRLELAKELLPNLRRVLVVYDAQDAASAAAARTAQAGRHRAGLAIRWVPGELLDAREDLVKKSPRQVALPC